MNRLSFFLFYLFSSLPLFSVNNSLFLSKLKGELQKEIPTSFFVIQANTQQSTFTLAPQIIERMQEIHNTQLCPYVIFIWKDDAGIGEKNLHTYLKRNFYIDTSVFIQAIISDELFDILGNNSNSVVHYFYNQKPYIKIDGKYENLNKLLPYDLFSFNFEQQLLWEDSLIYHSNQVSYYPINDSLVIELADDNEIQVRLTDLKSGKIYSYLDNSSFDYISLFVKYMANLGLSEEEMRASSAYLDSIKRTPFKISHVYVKSPSEIYLVADGIISYRVKEKRYIPAEFKEETIVVNVGEYITMPFDMILKVDSSLKITSLKFIDRFENTKYNKSHFIETSTGFYIQDDMYFIYGYNYFANKDKTYDQFFKRNKSTQFIHQYSQDSLRITFNEMKKPVLIRPLGEFYFYLNGMSFFKLKDRNYVYLDYFPEIYEFEHPNPVYWVTADKLEYAFKKNNYDTSIADVKVPFYAFERGFLMNDKVLIIPYRKNEQFYLKFFNTKMEVIQELEITSQLQLKKEMASVYFHSRMAFFSGEFFNIIYCKEGNCHNYRYKIKINPYQSGYFKDAERFSN